MARSRARKIATSLPPCADGSQSSGHNPANRICWVPVLDRVAMLRVDGTADERIVAIAACQRGRASRWQLLQAGISADAIEHRLARQRLHPLATGVYAVGHAAAVELGAETALLLAAGPGAVLSHRSAIALWELLRSRTSEIHVTVANRAPPRRSGARFHRTCTLAAWDITIRRGLPVTAVARALLDAAPQLTMRELELALDTALRRGLVRISQVADVVERHPRRPGVAMVRDLLGSEGGTVTRSEAEEMLLALIRRARLPEPELNARLHGYEVDALWRRERLVVEVDGYEYHRSRMAFEADRAKGTALTAAGYPVLRLTVRQIRDQPLRVVVQLAQALARGSARRDA